MNLSPLGWALRCRAGDDYSYADRGMAPVMDTELFALIDTCAGRGLELFADDAGLRVEELEV